MNYLKIQLFGRLGLQAQDGSELQVSGKKVRGLLAYLAANYLRRVTRDELIGLLWGERFETQARQSLRECLSRLRREMGENPSKCLQADRDHVWLAAGLAEIDLQHFEQGRSSSDINALATALDIYQEPLLDGLDIKESGFETWVREERHRYRDIACDLCLNLGQKYLDAENYAAAITTARRWLQLDKTQEGGHQLLIEALFLEGDRAGAIKQYQTCRDLILAEYNVEPGAKLQNLFQEISQPVAIVAATTNKTVSPAKPSETGHKPKITVRPFENLSDDAEQAHFASGITLDITTALIKNRWLSVIAHHSSSVFQGVNQRQVDVPPELDADYLVEGNVRKAGSRVRINVQLLDARTGEHVWAERYDRHLEDIFDLQDEITRTISGSIEPEVGAVERQRAMHKSTENLDAWGLFHVGLSHFFKFTADDNIRSQELFSQCIQLDPNFAEAHGWWANAKILAMTYFETNPDQEFMDQALDAAKRAVEIDNQNAASQFILGRVYLARREYSQAIAALETAIGLNPSLALAYCGLGDSLAYEGQLDAAIRQFETAINLSPRDPQLWAFYSYGALAHLFAHQFQDAIEWSENAIRIPNCQFWAYAHRVAALGHLTGKSSLEVQEIEFKRSKALTELTRMQPDFSVAFADRKLFYIKRPEQRQIYLDGLKKSGVGA